MYIYYVLWHNIMYRGIIVQKTILVGVNQLYIENSTANTK